ncbi:rod shape-determining protein [Oceanivirga salmonicida]|uniref:rod shape-determining protein n=1 Tax=Oceanivirga salmonicida TaxID=1769291 RepID=UPI000829C027|nr:rod shape-determining protein [Oceanivirga salmonicida]
MKILKNLKKSLFKNRTLKEVGIDLGTANTVIYVRDKGIVLDEPTYIAKNNRTDKLDKAGEEAKKISGRVPKYIDIIRPLKDGVISNYEAVLVMLEEFFERISEENESPDKVIVCVPSGVTQVERRSVFNVVLDAGAKEVYLVEEPIVAAIGAGIDIFQPKGHLIVNVGAGTTEISFISSGGSSISRSIRVAGDHLDQDIVEFIKEQYSILVGIKTAELLKIKANSSQNEKEQFEIRGIGTQNSLPRSIEIVGTQVDIAISNKINAIIDNIKLALEDIEPEISADIYETGIFLAGGGANIRILKKRIEEEFKLKVTVSENAIHAVINGIAKILEDTEKYKDLIMSDHVEY